MKTGKRGLLLLGSLCIVLSLASCGFMSGSGTASITTDQSNYRPGAPIKVSVVNNQQVPIYAFDTKAGCSILSLNMKVNGGWQEVQTRPCALDRDPAVVKIDPGQTYSATISDDKSGFLAAGSYRLVLTYALSPNMISSENRNKNVL
ncbi:MAG: hypothetical protein J2P37_36640, partial [Ktedonobacteraceae bacterium]|nr:hypothetical protein [Ktedonobacteraceae bacterium]